MRQPTRTGPRLPRQLLDEVDRGDAITSQRKVLNSRSRKEQRKAARHQRKSNQKEASHRHNQGRINSRIQGSDHTHDPRTEKDNAAQDDGPVLSEDDDVRVSSSPVGSFPGDSSSGSRSDSSDETPVRETRPPKKVQDKIAEDDAEIAALERALGLKGKKGLSKSFHDDGLADLLEGLESPIDDTVDRHGKRKHDIEDEWLASKRRKAQDDQPPGGSTMMIEDGRTEDGSDGGYHDMHLGPNTDLEETFGGFSEGEEITVSKATTVRENPYAPPVATLTNDSGAKYIPPSRRVQDLSDQGLLHQLRRRAQGLVNRLSETNMISILAGIQDLYRDNPRQHTSTILQDILMDLLCDPTVLSDTFIVLHAGFIAALYKIVGVEFGAQIVQKVVEHFDRISSKQSFGDNNGKELSNLILVLSELYNFRIIGSNLIYDFARQCIANISEENTELLLRIARSSGSQLRHEDPSSLKDIVMRLHAEVAKLDPASLSTRIKFMIETLDSLKNNCMKTDAAASAIHHEHVSRMKQILSSPKFNSSSSGEPLRIGLDDIRNIPKSGRWWLTGASYRDVEPQARKQPSQQERAAGTHVQTDDIDTGVSLHQLAKTQRMNTDARRSIFVAIMSASDYKEACARILKLRLKKSQELEIPKVLIHCAGAEKAFNPYYSLIAMELCADRKLKIAFQFALWDLFKLTGEHPESAYDTQEQEQSLEARSLVNLAKLYGALVADGGLSFSCLKNLNFAYLTVQTKMFLELFFIAAFVHSQRQSRGDRYKRRIMDMFSKLQETPDILPGLRLFLSKVVRKTDMVGNTWESKTVKWGCKVADDILKRIISNDKDS